MIYFKTILFLFVGKLFVGDKKLFKSSYLISFMMTVSVFAQPTDVFFSEYVEGSSNNKALELYNGTGSSIDLGSDNYTIEFYFNGSSTSSTTISLVGVINDQDVFVLADDGADVTILAVTDQTSTSSFYNGDDAIVLKKGSTILDVIGQVGFDPGSEWGTGSTSTADNTLRRKAGTTSGDFNPGDVFNPASEWDGYATDTFDGLGSPSPLPVELTYFSASSVGDGVLLNWRTETEVNNYGFDIQKKVGNLQSSTCNWEKIGFVEGHGNSNSPKEYSFIDRNIFDGKYSYRLKQIDNDGTFTYSNVIDIDANTLLYYELDQNYPNPFNPTTNIKYTVPEEAKVTVKVFNMLGQDVAVLVNRQMEAGTHEINFDGTYLNSGIYFYRIEVGNFVNVKKMTLLK